MDTTIEREFFSLFDRGGVVCNLISLMFHTYNLPEPKDVYAVANDNEKRQDIESLSPRHFHSELDHIVKFTKEWKEWFLFDDSSPLIDDFSLLIEEVESNLRELKEDKCATERYIFSLLKPFTAGKYCIAYVFEPTNREAKLSKLIRRLEDVNRYLKTDPSEEAPFVIETNKSVIENCKKEIARAKKVADEIRKKLPHPNTILKFMPINNVEECLCFWLNVYEEFTSHLDYLLLAYGFNLLQLQEVSGMYLTKYHPICGLIERCGNDTLVSYYISRLPKPQPQTTEKQPCNNRETTDNKSKITKEERKWYSLAIANGMAEETESGYRWLYNSGSKASLSYFIYKVFGNNTIEFNRLGELWGVGRFDTNLTNVLNAQKPQRWRGQIDALFSD